MADAVSGRNMKCEKTVFHSLSSSHVYANLFTVFIFTLHPLFPLSSSFQSQFIRFRKIFVGNLYVILCGWIKLLSLYSAFIISGWLKCLSHSRECRCMCVCVWVGSFVPISRPQFIRYDTIFDISKSTDCCRFVIRTETHRKWQIFEFAAELSCYLS